MALLLTLKTHLADLSFHNKFSLEYLAIANQNCWSIFYEKSVHFLGTFMICIDIFKRFQIVLLVGGIFNILTNTIQ